MYIYIYIYNNCASEDTGERQGGDGIRQKEGGRGGVSRSKEGGHASYAESPRGGGNRGSPSTWQALYIFY